MDFDREINLRGLNCPLPILRTKKALAEMLSGEVLKVIVTDPSAPHDFEQFAKQTGNQLLLVTEADQEFVLFMQRK